MLKRNLLDPLLEHAKGDDQVLAVGLFGSTARDENSKESDIDICLFLKPGPHSPLELSRKKLDYSKRFDLDIQIFQQLPLYIQVRILKEGKVLHCADEDALYELAFSAIREFADYEHIYRHYLKEVARAG